MYPVTALYETHKKNQVSSVNANPVDDTVEGIPNREFAKVYVFYDMYRKVRKCRKKIVFFFFGYLFSHIAL